MRWNDLDIFIAVATLGSFTQAAEQMELPKSSVSRAVARLEQMLGTRLVERNTRRLILTDAGQQLLQQTQPLFERLRDILTDTQASHSLPQGILRIAATHEFGILRLSSIITDLLHRYPGLEAEVTLTPEPLDPLSSGNDVVFRIENDILPDSSLVMRRIYVVSSQLYAAPLLVQRLGEPQTPADLLRWPCITQRTDEVWSLQGPDGHIEEIHPSGPLRSASQSMRQRAILDGLGAGPLVATFYQPEVAAGRLQPLLPGYKLPPTRVYALLPSRRQMPAKVRVFLDAVAASLANTPAT